MDAHIDRILIPQDRIEHRVCELANAIAADLPHGRDGEPRLTIVAVLTGSLIFLADLIRRLPILMRLELLAVSSYRGKTTRPGDLRIDAEPDANLAGHNVLIVDDILDSGATLRAVHGLVASRKPATLRTCVLLRKVTAAAPSIEADYVGFEIPDAFVVGYGLDHDGHYRNLPDLVTLRPEVLGE